MPAISVIIPTYNRNTWVRRAIDSVLAQSLPPEEIIVVDDGSDDATAECLDAHYPAITVIRQTNQGVSAARNRGIRVSKGDWIALLDSDDVWHEQKLAQQWNMLDDHPDYRVCHTDEIWIRNGVRVNPMKKHQKHGGMIFRQCLQRCAMSPSSILIHRSVFEHVGLFDETLPACEDYDLWLRICAHYPVCYVNRPLLTKYGGHADQLSRCHWGMDRFRIRSLARLVDNTGLEPGDETAAITVLLQKLQIYLQGAQKHDNKQHVNEFRQLQQRYQQSTCLTL